MRHNAMPIRPWDRQPNEDPDAFNALIKWLDAGTHRNMVRLSKQTGIEPSALDSWAIRYFWHRRAHAWDVEQDRLRLLNHRNDLEKMCDRHGKIARSMGAKLVERLKSINVEELGPREVATWFKVIVDVERHALGEEFIKRRVRGRPFADNDPNPHGKDGRFVPKVISVDSTSAEQPDPAAH